MKDDDGLFRWVQELAGLGCWSWDVQGDLVTWTDGLYAIFGVQPTRFAASFEGYLSLVHPDDRDRVAGEVQNALRNRSGFELVERVIRPDGTVRVLETVGTVECGEDGEARRMVGVCMDVTERRLLQEKLAATERLSSVARIARGLAHELNSPLFAVRAGIEELMQRRAASPDSAPADERAILEEVSEAVSRMADVLHELRAEASPSEPADSVPLDAVVRGALAMAGADIKRRAQLSVEFCETLHVEASRTQLGQVILHLLDNASRAIEEGAVEDNHVRVALKRHGDFAELRISDTGVGLPEPDEDRLFEAFVTTREVGDGQGLGLYFARQVLDEIGGTIDLVANASGRGAEAVVRLPLAQSHDLRDEGARTRLRVLVVDDDPLGRRSLMRLLRGHHGTVVGSGTEALARFEEDRAFDVVLCDLNMPRIPGHRLFERVAERWPELAARFWFITGGACDDESADFLAARPDRVLYKPVDPRELLRVLERSNPLRDRRRTSVPPSGSRVHERR